MEIVKAAQTWLEVFSKRGDCARIRLVQNFDATPTLEKETIGEFGTIGAALSATKLTNWEGSLSYVESDDATLIQLLMNVAPNASQLVVLNPGRWSEVGLVANVRNAAGKVFRSFVGLPGMPASAPIAIAIDGNTNARKIDLTLPNLFDVYNAAAKFEHFDAADFTLNVDKYETALAKTPVEIPAGQVHDVAASYFFVRKNGEIVTSGFAVAGGMLEIGSVAPQAGDVWDIVYPYNDLI